MAEAAEFRFNAGSLSLALAATVRRRATLAQDVLQPEGAPGRWLQAAGLARVPMRLTAAQERELLRVREAICALGDALVARRALPQGAAQIVNAAAARPIAAPQLQARSGSMTLAARDPFGSALAAVARDAIELFAGPLRERVKACAQDDCRVLFLDDSPSARRRWCSMDRCGSRAKGKAFRERHAH